MPFEIVRNDITHMQVDAIVNAANTSLLGGGGVDGCIHRAAGKQLLEECRTLGGCATGQAKVTKGYKLPARYVIHTVGPVWHGGMHNEADLLASCYRESLRLAAELGCESVAFPMISTGVYRYPKDEALQIAVREITGFLTQHDMLVYLVVFDRAAFALSQKVFQAVRDYIDETYVDELREYDRSNYPVRGEMLSESQVHYAPAVKYSPLLKPTGAELMESASLDELVKDVEASFSQHLFRLIDEKGKTDPEVYKKANLDRKLFSKIRNNVNYKPKKETALALAIALELNLDETRDFIGRAGYALTHSSIADIIVEYYILQRCYDIHQINITLFQFEQPLIGG